MSQAAAPRHILIFEAYTDANIGSGALVENTVNLLKAKYPGAEIRIMAHYPEAFHYENVESVPDVYEYPYLKPRWIQVIWLSKTLFWLAGLYLQAFLFKRRPFPFFKEKARHFQWADLVVSVGAERINDKFVNIQVFSALSLGLLKAMGKKVVFFPSTIGPFFYRPTRWLSSSVLRKLDLVYTRDSQSTRTCLETLKLDPAKVIETADVAVLQAKEGPESSWELLGSFHGKPLAPGTPLVGISVLEWTYRANKVETPYSNFESYLREMVKLADSLVERHGVKIVFFPTNYRVHGCRDDDVTTSRQVRDRMAHAESAILIDRLTTPSQFKGMLACSRVNIVTRMHACILSTGAGIPTLSVNYLFKLKEYMESLGLADFSVDIEEFNAEALLPAFDRMWKSREDWSRRINAAIESKKESLTRALERMDGFIR
jgi:polysaccharide pyruvyl transferase WcaK-like protein